jgi:hypothetical protein
MTPAPEMDVLDHPTDHWMLAHFLFRSTTWLPDILQDVDLADIMKLQFSD